MEDDLEQFKKIKDVSQHFSKDIFLLFESKYKSNDEMNDLRELIGGLVISLKKIKLIMIKKEVWDEFDETINDYLKEVESVSFEED